MIQLLDLKRKENKLEIFIFGSLLLMGIMISSRYFLIFHIMIELFCIIIGCIIFVLVYQSPSKNLSNYILILGVGFLFISVFDLMHIITYKGMNILNIPGANLATQYWIISRYMQSITFLLAFFSFKYNIKIHFNKLFSGYFIVTIILGVTLFLDIFPDCYIEGSGLTNFKIISEYLISAIYIISFYLMHTTKDQLNKHIYIGFIFFIVFSILSEISFTFYIEVYGISNIVGHVFKFLAFYVIYYITVKVAIKQPNELLFGKFQETERGFDLAIENADISLVKWDVKQQRLLFDKNGAQMFENKSKKIYTRDEFYSLIHPEDLEKFEKVINDFKTKNNNSFAFEFRVILKERKIIWFKITGTIVDDLMSNISRIIFIIKDITGQKTLINQVDIERAKFQQLFENANLAIALLSTDNRIIQINKRFIEKFGYTNKEAKGSIIDDLITPKEYMDRGIKNSMRVINGESVELEDIKRTKDNKRINVLINAFPIKLDESNLGLYAIYSDITQQKNNEKYIRYLSFHDELTGLYNRRYFVNEIERLDSSRRLPISIIMGDLNNLKLINDNYGHNLGDKYLKLMSNVLRESIRSEDILARIGGDEFAIILPEADKTIVDDICSRISKGCNKLTQNINLPRPISISLGYAIKRRPSENLEKVFNEADILMYKTKNNQKINLRGGDEFEETI